MRSTLPRYTLLMLLVGVIPLSGFSKLPDEFRDHIPTLGPHAATLYVWGKTQVTRRGPNAGTFEASIRDMAAATRMAITTIQSCRKKLIPNYWTVTKRGTSPSSKTRYLVAELPRSTRISVPATDTVAAEPYQQATRYRISTQHGTVPADDTDVPASTSKQKTYDAPRRSRRIEDEEQEYSLTIDRGAGNDSAQNDAPDADELLEKIASEWKRLGGPNPYPAKMFTGGVTNQIIANFKGVEGVDIAAHLARVLEALPRFIAWRRNSGMSLPYLPKWVAEFDPGSTMESPQQKGSFVTDAIKQAVQD